MNWRNPAWMLIADGEIDQICDSEAEAKREAKDLRDLGCEVKIKHFTSRALAEQYEDDQKEW